MLKSILEPVSAKLQMEEFVRDRFPATLGEVVLFTGVDGYDVYNPSIPFEIDGMTVIAGRVENRSNEESDTMFFRKNGAKWMLIPDAPVIKHQQDPFITFIDGELWIGGVYVEWDGPKLVDYYTQFYKGKSILKLEKAFSGPHFMKDIRLLQMNDGRIAVFSRPQGQKMLDKYGCIAKIGFDIANKTDDIDSDFIENTPLLEGQFLPEEWGGVNQAYVLSNSLIGIIGHKSWGEYIDNVHIIHYYSIAFALNPATREVTQTKIISTRDCFPKGPQKNTRTADVTFTSGIIREPYKKCTLYTGLNDCQVGKITLDDPLWEYEQIEI